MFDNTDLYTLRTEIDEGMTHYFVSFEDVEDVRRETEVSRPVYLEFLRFIKVERNMRRWDERHIEQSDVTEETLHRRAVCISKSAEEVAFDCMRNEQLRLSFLRLTDVQRRRFVLYHEFGLTLGQISEIEGCAFQVVARSIKAAEKKIRKFFEMNG